MGIKSTVKLNNGVEIPLLGLGVFLSKEGAEVENAVKYALEAGYRHIDTAAIYHNETGVGKAVKASGISRDEIFITSKVWNSDQGYQSTFKAFDASLEKLKVDYLDLYLIHWPKGDLSVETWKAMEELYKAGKIRAIGVSNFLEHHLADFLPHCSIMPAVDQVEFHPYLQQPLLQQFCIRENIQIEAWSPIMKGKVNEIPLLKALAVKYGKTPVQITIRWELQKGIVTIPKSVKNERIISNVDVFDFEILADDMDKIDNLDKHYRIGADPDNFNF
ncbi:MAG: aldo/keto reductase [Prolixibacteraceae bacterium]|nr:aldo/keto reductase [Prolixibacteraceae bacterium]